MSQETTETKKETKKGTPNSSTTKVSEPSLNLDEIREIAEMVEQYGFTDFEYENEKIRVRLSKTPAPQIVQAVQPVSALPAVQAKTELAKPETSHPGAKSDAAAAADEDLHKIVSPIVGTFYRSPAPEKPAYVKEGDSVSSETVVCIVEAMKLMNEIQAEVSGEVVKVYVENGQPVEYGQPLFGIKK